MEPLPAREALEEAVSAANLLTDKTVSTHIVMPETEVPGTYRLELSSVENLSGFRLREIDVGQPYALRSFEIVHGDDTFSVDVDFLSCNNGSHLDAHGKRFKCLDLFDVVAFRFIPTRQNSAIVVNVTMPCPDPPVVLVDLFFGSLSVWFTFAPLAWKWCPVFRLAPGARQLLPVVASDYRFVIGNRHRTAVSFKTPGRITMGMLEGGQSERSLVLNLAQAVQLTAVASVDNVQPVILYVAHGVPL